MQSSGGTPMLIQLNDIQKNMKGYLLDCRINSLQELLRFYGLSLNAYNIMILTESYSFQYGKIDFFEQSVFDVPYAVASENNLEYKLFDALKIPYQIEILDESLQSWSKMKEIVKRNIPMIIKIDERVIHQSKTLHPKNKKINIRYVSTPLFLGYSDDERLVYLFWTNTNNMVYPTTIPIDQFHKFRNTYCLPYSPNYECSYLMEARPLDGITDAIIQDKTYEALRNIVKKMNNSYGELEIKENTFCKEYCTGLFAMERLHKDLEDMLSKSIKEKDNINYRKKVIFSILFLRNNLITGSLSAFREEFGLGLLNFAEKINDLIMKKVANEIILASKMWKKWFALISKLPYDDKKFISNMKSIVSLFEKILLSEKYAYQLLVNSDLMR